MKTYEWDLEELEHYDEVNDTQDIIDHNHSGRLKELLHLKDEFICSDLVLVLDIGDNDEGLKERYWAYVVNNRLPDYFENSYYKVPKRFHNEFNSVW